MSAFSISKNQNSRAFQRRVDAGPAAGVISTPVGPQNVSFGCINSPPALALAAFLPAAPEVTSYQEAKRWAVSQGLCRQRHAMNLRLVNIVRRLNGLPAFILKPGEAE